MKAGQKPVAAISKKTWISKIIILLLIAAVIVGLVAAVRAYRREIVCPVSMTVQSPSGEKSLTGELTFRRALFEPTAVSGWLRLDGSVYRAADHAPDGTFWQKLKGEPLTLTLTGESGDTLTAVGLENQHFDTLTFLTGTGETLTASAK